MRSDGDRRNEIKMNNRHSFPFFSLLFLLSTVPGQESFPQKPKPIPGHWRSLVGSYVAARETLLVLENGGQLKLRSGDETELTLREKNDLHFTITPATGSAESMVLFSVSPDSIWLAIGKRRFLNTSIYFDRVAFRVRPLRPVHELQNVALRSTPPLERGEFFDADLVDLTKLDSTIKLDIRYATTNNFLGAVFYSEARAFLQRRAADAVLRAHRWLKQFGYGLLIHDAYRPWYVTKMFWDATPDHQKDFVADPSKGSRHNRGCAVDLTMYDLATGEPVEMVSGYDEFSPRAFPDHPGGTSLQRWHRKLLRQAMEREGFTVYRWEWWHFDFIGWEQYPIMNITFDKIK